MRPSYTGLYRARRLGRAPRVDVHLPDLPGPLPSVVLAHGGAFLGGSRRENAVRWLGRVLLDAGFAVAAFDYRTIVHGGGFQEAVDDARAMVAWWRRQAERFELDPERVAMVGISAGAAVSMVAADQPWRLAGFYGPYDFGRLPLGRLATSVLLDERDPARLAWRSPFNVCTTRTPLLLLHGTGDRLVPVAHAEAMLRARRTRGLPVSLQLYPGAGHAFLDHPGLRVWDDAVGDLLTFLLEP